MSAAETALSMQLLDIWHCGCHGCPHQWHGCAQAMSYHRRTVPLKCPGHVMPLMPRMSWMPWKSVKGGSLEVMLILKKKICLRTHIIRSWMHSSRHNFQNSSSALMRRSFDCCKEALEQIVHVWLFPISSLVLLTTTTLVQMSVLYSFSYAVMLNRWKNFKDQEVSESKREQRRCARKLGHKLLLLSLICNSRKTRSQLREESPIRNLKMAAFQLLITNLGS